jgi:hypothetical protein
MGLAAFLSLLTDILLLGKQGYPLTLVCQSSGESLVSLCVGADPPAQWTAFRLYVFLPLGLALTIIPVMADTSV